MYQINDLAISTQHEQFRQVKIIARPNTVGGLYRVQAVGSSFTWYCSEEKLLPSGPSNLPQGEGFQLMIDYQPVGEPVTENDMLAWTHIFKRHFPTSLIGWIIAS